MKPLPLPDPEGPLPGASATRSEPCECPRCAELEERLAHLQQRERLIWDAVPAMVWLKDRDNRVLRVNRAAAESMGLPPDQIEGRSTYDLYPEEAAAYHQDDLAVIASRRPKLGIIEPLTTASGEKRWVRTDKIPSFDERGEAVGVLVFAVDITEQKRAEMLLAHQNQFLREVVACSPFEESLSLLARAVREQMPGSVCTFLLEGTAGTALLEGEARRTVPPVPPDLQALFEDVAAGCLGGPGLAGRRALCVDLREPRWAGRGPGAARLGVCLVWCEPILSSAGRVLGVLVVGTPRPAAAQPGAPLEVRPLESAAHLAAVAVEAVRSREQLLHNALHDPLTDLPNRALLLARLASAMQRRTPRRFAALFIDVDRFKVVNDSLGHMLGDELLKAVAARLRSCLRQGDTVARLGGDEFGLLLDGLDTEAEAALLARRIQDVLEAPFDLAGHEVYTSVSIGITFSSPAYRQPEEMLRDADTAMYRAKAEGRSRLALFHPVMHERALSQLKLESSLRRALERQEFLLYYQPIVEILDGSISGFEALLRWRHPELGLLLPDEFLAAAEDTGIMPQLGAWVIREACRQARAWQRECLLGDRLEMHVNLHALQLAQRSLVDQVAAVLQETGLTPESLNFEITEGVLLRDLEASIETLHALRNLGVGLSLDDFGTGYSSLNYLLRFPVTALKIDRSFVGCIRDGNDDLTIVESIASLAHTLSLDVIAEGVETPHQLGVLRRLGCELAQGFLFSPPVEARIARALLSAPPSWAGAVQEGSA